MCLGIPGKITTIFEEDANRCLLLQTDERPDQTRRILQVTADVYVGANGIDAQARSKIIERHHALQRMLRPQTVVIPYANNLADRMPFDRVEARRAIGHVLSAIEALVLLHQRQRDLDFDGRLIVWLSCDIDN